MGLIFFGKTKPDNRMVEYDQAVVRLGLEKAQLESDVEATVRQIRNLGITRDFILSAILRERKNLSKEKQDEIDGQLSVFFDYEAKIAEAKKNLEKLLHDQKMIAGSIEEKQKFLVSAQGELENLENKKNDMGKSIVALEETRRENVRNNASIRATLADSEKVRDGIAFEVRDLGVAKQSVQGELTSKYKELEELNEIISILRTSNKEGLDIVASFDGERKRLKDKEEKLEATRHDLIVYAKRLQGERKKAGIATPMILPVEIEK